MTSAPDAIIVGAGLNGAATAFFLLQRGLGRVLILDAGLPGDGASGDAVGLLRTHYDNRPETVLAVLSMPWFREWHDRIGGSCGWLPTGFFRFVSHDEMWKLVANTAVQQELGDSAQVLSSDDLHGLAPSFRIDDIGGAVYEPDSGTADNGLATRTLLERACSEGAELMPFTRVDRVLLGRDDAVTGVATSRGEVAAPIVVVAAGVGSRDLGLRSGFDLPCRPQALAATEVHVGDHVVVPGSYMDPITDSWLAQRLDGRALISSGKPTGPLGESSGLGRVSRRLPALSSATVIREWTRADGFAPDGKPVIGAVPGRAGLFVNIAGAGKGHKVAPAVALALSELIIDGAGMTVDLTPFGLERFATALQPWSTTEYRQRTIG